MRARDTQLALVVIGLVVSAALMSGALSTWRAVFSLLTLSGTLIAFSIWVLGRATRSRGLFIVGGASLLASTLWLEFVLAPVGSPLSWLLSFALAWMIAPFAAFALIWLAERLSPGRLR